MVGTGVAAKNGILIKVRDSRVRAQQAPCKWQWALNPFVAHCATYKLRAQTCVVLWMRCQGAFIAFSQMHPCPGIVWVDHIALFVMVMVEAVRPSL